MTCEARSIVNTPAKPQDKSTPPGDSVDDTTVRVTAGLWSACLVLAIFNPGWPQGIDRGPAKPGRLRPIADYFDSAIGVGYPAKDLPLSVFPGASMSSRPIAPVFVSALLSLLAAGCGGEDIDTMPKAFLQLLDDTTAALKDIKDPETARAAEPKLKELAARKSKLDEQAKATKMSKENMEKSDARYAEPMKYAAEKMRAEIMRIAAASPEAAEIVATAMGMR